MAWTPSASKPLLPSFAGWNHCVECFVDLRYVPAGRGERFLFGALTIEFCVDFVHTQDVGCCKIWTTSTQAESLKSRLIRLIDLNKAKSWLWLSLHCTLQCDPHIMTWCLTSVACKIPTISWEKCQQMSFLSKTGTFLSHKDDISALIHCDSTLWTNNQHRTYLVQIAGWMATRAMGSYVQQDSPSVEQAS